MYKALAVHPAICNSELFAGISSPEIEGIVSCARALDFAPGAVVHVEGDPILQVLLLTQGLIKKSQSTESGQEVVLRLCVAGEIISEATSIVGRRHGSTALAMAHCKALGWDSASFNAIVERLPDLRANVGRILEHRLAELSERVLEVSTKAASPRLAIHLIRLANRIGKCVGDHIELRVSQEMLGQMTGMTLSSVHRLLSIWKEQGIVRLRRETVEIHNLPQLLSHAESIPCSTESGPTVGGEGFSAGVAITDGRPVWAHKSLGAD
jgi:CRP-like cAMP-binding protein